MSDLSKKGRSSRLKGQRGERELASELSDLLGITLKRRVRNHAQDGDIEGLPGYSVEVKNCASLNLKAWWKQTVDQARTRDEIPVLFYKVQRRGFRAVVPIQPMLGMHVIHEMLDYTVEMSLPAFAMYYRETLSK